MRNKNSKDIKDFYKDLFPENVNSELASDIDALKEKELIDQEINKKALSSIANTESNFVFKMA